jgi:succinate dehydrogenase / fumarate reductase flavoprotein subunit
MKIFPGMHYTMGGLWVDFNQQTNIPGVFAAGEADYSIHGANRLGANSLLSCIYGGFVAGPNAMAYAKSLPAQTGDGGAAAELQRQKEKNEVLLKSTGSENPFKIWRELGETMTKHATIVRYNTGLDEADAKLVELLSRYKNINLSDKSQWANTSFAFTRQLYNMLELARVIVQGARQRDESRGAHYKPDFPNRDDEHFLKTTKAAFVGGAPHISFEDVDTQWIKPRPLAPAIRQLSSAIQPCIMSMHPTLTTAIYVLIAVVFLSIVTYMILYTRGLRTRRDSIEKLGRPPISKEEGIAISTMKKEKTGRTGTIS